MPPSLFGSLKYRESPNSADFGANRNRTIRKSALNGDLYVLTKSAPFWYKNWQFFWKKTHYIREFGQFSAVLKPHYSKPHYPGTPCILIITKSATNMYKALKQVLI